MRLADEANTVIGVVASRRVDKSRSNKGRRDGS